MFGNGLVRLAEASFHPPTLDAGGDGDEAEIPGVLLEYNTYVADRRNDTTAVAGSSCGREVQVTLFAAHPPRVSYLCVFCRHEEMIAVEPKVLATDDNLLLLRIVISPEKNLIDGCDLYIYQPAGSHGPSLQRLPRPPGDIILLPNHVGILSCGGPANGLSLQDKSYMVAALCNPGDLLALGGRGRFVLLVYNSKLQTWTAINVSVEDQHFQKYQEEGYLLHFNTRAIAVGGEDATVAFVDLWNGILLCDLSHVKDKPCLRYVPLPAPSGSPSDADAYLSRDIAVVDGHFKFVQSRPKCKDCPTCGGDDYFWKFAVWTRPVSSSSLLDDSWQLVCDMESSRMDVKTCPDFELLPKLGDNTSAPFRRLLISHPTLSWNNCSTDDTVWFMVKVKQFDARAWVIAVDIMNNRLQGVAEFDAQRYTVTGFAYRHSRISKYLNKQRAPECNTSASAGVVVTVPMITASIPPVITDHVTHHDVITDQLMNEDTNNNTSKPTGMAALCQAGEDDDEPMPPQFSTASQLEKACTISNNSESNAISSVIPPQLQFGGIPFDEEKYRKNMGKFTTTGLSSKIIFKGAALLRSEEKMKPAKYLSIGSMHSNLILTATLR